MVINMYLNNATITVCAVKILVILNLMYTFYIINLQKNVFKPTKHEIKKSAFFAIEPDKTEMSHYFVSLLCKNIHTLY